MPETPILILRFPDGDVQYQSTRGELPVGAKIRARGTFWRIREYAAGGAAILEVFEVLGQGTPGSRTINPTPIGDEPMTIEVLAVA